MTKQTDHYQNEFSAVWPGLPGYKTSWVDHLRLKSINRFAQKGFPQARAEDWKYTDLAELFSQSYHTINQKNTELTRELIKPRLTEIDAAITLVFVNGQLLQTIRDKNEVPGLMVTNLQDAIAQRSNSLKEYLNADPETVTAFETLNMAFMNDGVCLVVDPETVVEKPVVILQIVTEEAELGNINTRNLLVFGENSKIRVIEKYLHLRENSNYLTNTVTQTILKPGAEVDYFRIQDESTAAFHFGVHRISLQKNSRMAFHDFSFGGRLSRNNLKVDFAGENAFCSLNGLLMVDGDRQVDVYTDMEHRLPNCKSEEAYRGVLNEKAKAVFRGKIKVFKDAQKTDARLNNANLLLSDDAEVNTMPQLEIYADDVKCSHGSGSGQLDQEQLFYLISRGIDEATAHDFLIYAFANSAIERIDSKEIKSHIRSLLLDKLPSSSVIKELIK